MRYSVQSRDRIFLKSYEFFSFAKNIGKNVSKNISKNLSGKYSQKLLDHSKQSATDTFKTASKRAIQKTEEATGDLIGNKIANAGARCYDTRITKISKIQLQMSMIKKCLKKDIYLRKKDEKLFMKLD